MEQSETFADRSFHSSVAGIAELTAYVRARAGAQPSYRLLDIGCGDGGLIFALLRELPGVTALGIDISADNIAMAERQRFDMPDDIRERSRFTVGDYLRDDYEGFDVVTSNSVLHLLPCSDDDLIRCLARDINANGISVHALPCESLGNSIRLGLRRLFRLVPLSWLEACALPLAKLLYPGWNPQVLRERIVYLQILPQRLFGSSFRERLRTYGLRVVYEGQMAQSSFLKLRHKIVALQKIDPVGNATVSEAARLRR